MRILGIDPGLRFSGWGVVDYDGYHLRYVSHGVVKSKATEEMALRLGCIFSGISKIISDALPEEIAMEQIFINGNPASSMKLGMARGAAICACGVSDFKVYEYAPNTIKKTIVGAGHASKDQVSLMVQRLLNVNDISGDAADALAIAICHAHHRSINSMLQKNKKVAL